MWWLLACAPDVYEAGITTDTDAGVYPLDVTFEASSPLAGTATWDFGEGGTATGDTVTHRFVGAGIFGVTLTVSDDRSTAVATVPITVGEPACPTMSPPELWGLVSDLSLDELSGIAASHREPDLFWVHQDNGDNPLLFALDAQGRVQSRHDIDGIEDFEDVATAIDPNDGEPLLFVGDIGDNDGERDEITVVVVDEPDPRVSGPFDGLRMTLHYPPGPAYNAETLLVDPRTLDLYVVTKDRDGASRVFAKRAPHDGPGPFVLEPVAEVSFAVGALSGLTTTGGDVSPDGSRIVIRTYLPRAHLWHRDGYLPFEAAFDRAPCAIALPSEAKSEAVAFTTDGAGLVSVSEGERQPLFYTAFDAE